MGLDTFIFFKTRGGAMPGLAEVLPQGCSIDPLEDGRFQDATHQVDQCWRWYSPGYERGPWPQIATVRMILLSTEEVEAVWYVNSTWDDFSVDPITAERVLEYCAHYMAKKS